MSKTVSSLVLLIGMTLGSSVSAKNCKQLFGEEYFTNRQQLRNEGKLKRLIEHSFEKEIEREFEAEIESAISQDFSNDVTKDLELIKPSEVNLGVEDQRNQAELINDDSGFNLQSIFEDWEKKQNA